MGCLPTRLRQPGARLLCLAWPTHTTLLPRPAQVLSYHVVPGVAAKAADLTDGQVRSGEGVERKRVGRAVGSGRTRGDARGACGGRSSPCLARSPPPSTARAAQVLPTLLPGGNLTVSIVDGDVFFLSAGAPPAKVIQVRPLRAAEEGGSRVQAGCGARPAPRAAL